MTPAEEQNLAAVLLAGRSLNEKQKLVLLDELLGLTHGGQLELATLARVQDALGEEDTGVENKMTWAQGALYLAGALRRGEMAVAGEYFARLSRKRELLSERANYFLIEVGRDYLALQPPPEGAQLRSRVIFAQAVASNTGDDRLLCRSVAVALQLMVVEGLWLKAAGIFAKDMDPFPFTPEERAAIDSAKLLLAQKEKAVRAWLGGEGKEEFAGRSSFQLLNLLKAAQKTQVGEVVPVGVK